MCVFMHNLPSIKNYIHMLVILKLFVYTICFQISHFVAYEWKNCIFYSFRFCPFFFLFNAHFSSFFSLPSLIFLCILCSPLCEYKIPFVANTKLYPLLFLLSLNKKSKYITQVSRLWRVWRGAFIKYGIFYHIFIFM